MSKQVKDKRPEITPIILAGGQGTRLRPLTGASRPKPFLRLFSNYSLLQETLLRVKHFFPPVIILHNSNLREGSSQLSHIGIEPHAIICEPDNRSTAAAIALAAFALEETGTVMAVMPSDHYIEDDEVLRMAIIRAAQNEELTMIGVRPQSADARYGYIEVEDGRIQRFIEKPSAAMARKLKGQGNCFWNTGLFVCRPQFFLNALKSHAPEIYGAVKAAHELQTKNGVFIYPDAEAYARAPAISVDYAVMEHCTEAKLIALNTVWHDIGTWSSLLRTKFEHLRKARKAA